MERYNFRIVLGDSHETMRKLCLQHHSRKLGEITVFFAVNGTVFLKIAGGF